ncbi:MAG: hypothetical protein JWQ68_2336 [Cryobacterium sp.]|jgi:uncharacterized protein (TIGR03083 family)|nr:hypothetical protein [Cryobacterium sp.]
MADFARYLPFSQREPVDETDVTHDWRAEIAATLNATADLLESLSPEQWGRPSMCGRWSVQDVAGHLVWRVGSSNRELLTSATRAYLGHYVNPHRAIDVLSRAAAEAPVEELVRRIREIAAAKATGSGRVGISELSETVVHGYDLSHPLNLPLAVSSRASGAVALRRSLTAPTEIKAVLQVRSLVATDAGWRVGRGPDLESSAETLILFLYGRSETTPLLS